MNLECRQIRERKYKLGREFRSLAMQVLIAMRDWDSHV